MADKGFAIQCPHCRKWNVWDNIHPEERFVRTVDEFDFIMNEFRKAKQQGQINNFSHSKLFRCKRPRWSCPASFEGFIFKEEKVALESLEKVPEAWAKRDFRLFKSDRENRWDERQDERYYGIIFCTESVPRQGDVEFEHLMDRKLVSRTIVGISCEVEAPLTIYAANIFEPKGKSPVVYWMPIEGYSLSGEPLVPPAYNMFCLTCRKIVVEQLVREFLEKEFGPDNCPLNGFGDGQRGLCAGRQAACLERDWNHCPAFIDERKQRCPCYNSDFDIIEKLRKMWELGELTLDGEAHRLGVDHRCHAKFRERAFPIIVHNHLVGVAMTGQVFFDQRELVDVDEFISNWFDLRGYEYELKSRQDILLLEEEQKLSKDGKAIFLMNKNQFDERLKRLEPNTAKIEEMANVRYRDIRSRSENAFRQEILAYIQRYKKAANFFTEPVLNVLKRMREFWAFKAVGFLCYSAQTKDVCLVSYSYEIEDEIDENGFGFPGEKVGEINLPYRQRYPLGWFYDPSDPEAPRNPWIKRFLPLIEDIRNKPSISLPQRGCYFLVVVPFGEEVYIFAFMARDIARVSRLKGRKPSSVSELCQEFMLGTCTEVIHEFADVRAFIKVELGNKQAKTAPIKIELVSKRKGAISHREEKTKADSKDPDETQG